MTDVSKKEIKEVRFCGRRSSVDIGFPAQTKEASVPPPEHLSLDDSQTVASTLKLIAQVMRWSGEKKKGPHCPTR